MVDFVERSRIVFRDEAVAIHHLVYEHEDFEHAARTLFDLVQRAQREHPGKARKLYLDIEGHRDAEGISDNDMFELQSVFLVWFMGDYLSEIHTPVYDIVNPKPQLNDLPERLDSYVRFVEPE